MPPAEPPASNQAGEAPVSKLEVLQWAAECGDLCVVRSLLTPANVNSCDQVNGLSLLSLAAGAGESGMVSLLIERGALLHRTDKEGYTAMHRAIWAGHEDCVELLCEAGADVHHKGLLHSGTALGLACQMGREAIVVRLLDRYGASILHAVDIHGMTPLCRATMAGHAGVVHELLHRGASPVQGDAIGRCYESACAAKTMSQRQAYNGILAYLAKGQAAQSVAGVR